MSKAIYEKQEERAMVTKTKAAKPKEKKPRATTLNLDEDLWSQVKIESIKKQITATEFVEEALRKELARIKK